MFSNKDIEYRAIVIINGLENRKFKVHQDNLGILDTEKDKLITKIPFSKILSLFIVGNTTITSPVIEKCNKNGVGVVILKPNLRPVIVYSKTAEGNFLLRQKQHRVEDTIEISKNIVFNKIYNQLSLLERIRKKDYQINKGIEYLKNILEKVEGIVNTDELMGLEGNASKIFFGIYFREFNWERRVPRMKKDEINSLLDIGYTILFNFVEVFISLFGFDLYVGVYHKLWFKRKSLVCDLIEPFRCIIDYQIRKSIKLGQFRYDDFELRKGQYHLKKEKNEHYRKVFFEILVSYKSEIFIYVRDYYRYFMNRKSVENFPKFGIKK